MVSVELDIFSGRPNPTWRLADSEAELLFEQLGDSSVALLSPDLVESKLGYRGLLVTLDAVEAQRLGGATRTTQFRIRSGIAVDTDEVTERWLLGTAPATAVESDVRGAAEDGITEGIETLNLSAEAVPQGAILAACTTFATSSTNFDFWNSNATHRTRNNCYNYASNWRQSTRFAQPGVKGGGQFTALTLDNIQSAMIRDGWSRSCTGQSLVVGLWIWPNRDYHFYRKTVNVGGQSRWCHKPGSTPATNRDNSGRIIIAPVTADNGNYTLGARTLWYRGSSNQVR